MGYEIYSKLIKIIEREKKKKKLRERKREYCTHIPSYKKRQAEGRAEENKGELEMVILVKGTLAKFSCHDKPKEWLTPMLSLYAPHYLLCSLMFITTTTHSSHYISLYISFIIKPLSPTPKHPTTQSLSKLVAFQHTSPFTHSLSQSKALAGYYFNIYFDIGE